MADETSEPTVPATHRKALTGPHVRLVGGIGLIVVVTGVALLVLSKRIKGASSSGAAGASLGSGTDTVPWENATYNVNYTLPSTGSTNNPGGTTAAPPPPSAPGGTSGTSHPPITSGQRSPHRTPRTGAHPHVSRHAVTVGGSGAGGSKSSSSASSAASSATAGTAYKQWGVDHYTPTQQTPSTGLVSANQQAFGQLGDLAGNVWNGLQAAGHWALFGS